MKKRKPATSASWKKKPMPARRKLLELDGHYAPAEYEKIRFGFVPRGPQDKWFVYLEEAWLKFHRSNTGSCIFQLQLLPDGDLVRAPQLLVNEDPTQFRSTDDEYNVSLVNYLVDTLLLGRFAPFPQAKQFSSADQQRHQEHVMGRKDDGGISLKLLNGRSHE